MQADERVKRRSEEVSADRKSVMVDQPAPLDCGHAEKQRTENNCREPEELEETHPIAIEGAFREHNRYAARQQEDRSQHRQIQHFTRSRARQTLADIKEVAGNEN